MTMQHTDTRISFIIPTYNNSDTILKTIESLFHQGLPIHDFEIIVVNDGSTDRTVQTIENCKGIVNIQLINQRNQGVATARNTGIRAAKGTYLFFLDADDFLKPNSLLEVMEAAEKFDVDAIGFTCERIWDTHTKVLYRGEDLTQPVDGIAWSRLYLMDYSYSTLFIYKRAFLVHHELSFHKHLSLWEDTLFLIQFLLVAKKVHYLNRPLYNYVYSTSSLSNRKSIRNIKNRLIIMGSLLSMRAQRTWNLAQRKYIENRLQLVSIELVNSLTRHRFKKQYRRFKSRAING